MAGWSLRRPRFRAAQRNNWGGAVGPALRDTHPKGEPCDDPHTARHYHPATVPAAARADVERLEADLEELAKTHGEASDVMIALRAQVEKARADLAERRTEAFKFRLEQKAAVLKRQADLAERHSRERRMKHLFCTILAAGATLAAGCAGEQAGGPGTAVVRVAPASAAADADAIETFCTHLASDEVLGDALKHLAESPGGADPYTGPDAAARLRADLQIERLRQTNLVGVHLAAGPLQRRTRVIRAIVEAALRLEPTAREKRLADLDEEQRTLTQTVEEAERRLWDLRQRLGLATTDAASDPRQMLLDAIQDLAAKKQPEFDAARDAWQRFQNLHARPPGRTEAKDTAALLAAYPDLAEEVERDPKVIAARVLAEEMERQTQEVAKTHGEASDVLIALRAQVEKTRADLAERRTEAFKFRLEQKAALLKRQADLAERDGAELARQIAQARTAAESIAADLETFRAEERRVEDLRARLTGVEEEAERLRVATAAGAALQVVQWP